IRFFKKSLIGWLFIIKPYLIKFFTLNSSAVFYFFKIMEEWKMRKMNYQNVKGTQDYLPNEEVVRRDIKRTIEDVFIQYGYKPLETPILNYTELLASKYGGG